jgi:hypothetical protein
VQAARFLRFLKEYFPTPDAQNLCAPSPDLARMLPDISISALPLTTRYRRLVLIWHSLGGVIIRQALVDEAIAYEGSHDPPSGGAGDGEREMGGCLSAAVRLFSPAIFGFEPTHFAGLCYNLLSENPTLGRFLRPVLRSNPISEDLQSGSHRLIELRRRTESLAGKYSWLQAFRAHLMFGTKESVVYMDRYDCDPVYAITEGQDHRSICKPNSHYKEPLAARGISHSSHSGT